MLVPSPVTSVCSTTSSEVPNAPSAPAVSSFTVTPAIPGSPPAWFRLSWMPSASRSSQTVSPSIACSVLPQRRSSPTLVSKRWSPGGSIAAPSSYTSSWPLTMVKVRSLGRVVSAKPAGTGFSRTAYVPGVSCSNHTMPSTVTAVAITLPFSSSSSKVLPGASGKAPSSGSKSPSPSTSRYPNT